MNIITILNYLNKNPSVVYRPPQRPQRCMVIWFIGSFGLNAALFLILKVIKRGQPEYHTGSNLF